jgi:hypothetical protein
MTCKTTLSTKSKASNWTSAKSKIPTSPIPKKANTGFKGKKRSEKIKKNKIIRDFLV